MRMTAVRSRAREKDVHGHMEYMQYKLTYEATADEGEDEKDVEDWQESTHTHACAYTDWGGVGWEGSKSKKKIVDNGLVF